MKHVGILAHSAEGSALCWLELCRRSTPVLGEHQHPEITMSILPMGRAMPAWEVEDFASVRAILAGSAERLNAAGCDFLVCPDNTAHLALETPGPQFALPALHIADVVAGEAARRGHRRLGILGTKWTMERALYVEAAARHGLTTLTPPPAERTFVNRAIFEELCAGVFTAPTRAAFARIIAGLAEAGCDAVVLGCTEIPLLIGETDSPLPTLSSTGLLAQAALDTAIGRAPMPTWRGGPLRAA